MKPDCISLAGSIAGLHRAVLSVMQYRSEGLTAEEKWKIYIFTSTGWDEERTETGVWR